MLRAEIQYGEFVRETTVKVTVVKRNETPQEREKSKLSELLQRAQEEDPESEKIQLPTEIEGQKNFLGRRYSGDWMEDSGGGSVVGGGSLFLPGQRPA